MKLNVGATDRFIRIVLAVILAVLVYLDYISGVAGTIALVLAGIFVLTGVIGFCPLYRLFGLHTASGKETTP